jgi:hypothetical protein
MSCNIARYVPLASISLTALNDPYSVFKIITIGDHTKHETRRFFREEVLKNLPEHLRPKLDFERLYDAFGGKIAHWQDYTADFGECTYKDK